MKRKRENKIVLYSNFDENIGLFEHAIGYFSTPVSSSTAGLISDIAEAMSPASTIVALAFYLPEFEHSMDFSEEKWKTIIKQIFPRKTLFGGTFEREWLVGYPTRPEHLKDYLKFSWDVSSDETLMILPYTKGNEHALLRDFEDEMLCYSSNERNLAISFPYIISRGWHGSWINVFSKNLGQDTIIDFLRKITNKELRVSSTPL